MKIKISYRLKELTPPRKKKKKKKRTIKPIKPPINCIFKGKKYRTDKNGNGVYIYSYAQKKWIGIIDPRLCNSHNIESLKRRIKNELDFLKEEDWK